MDSLYINSNVNFKCESAFLFYSIVHECSDIRYTNKEHHPIKCLNHNRHRHTTMLFPFEVKTTLRTEIGKRLKVLARG